LRSLAQILVICMSSVHPLPCNSRAHRTPALELAPFPTSVSSPGQEEGEWSSSTPFLPWLVPLVPLPISEIFLPSFHHNQSNFAF
jgi:hypothetical protein